MKKIILIFGLIAGVICGSMFFIFHSSDGQMNFDNGMLKGYITMTIALSSIFFAVKQFRDKYNGGNIKFLKAFLMGLAITLVAGCVYALFWEFYYQNYAPDFTVQYVAYMKEQWLSQGMSTQEIAKEAIALEQQFEPYTNNLLVRFGFTLMEILPVGFLISIFSALYWAIIKKRN